MDQNIKNRLVGLVVILAIAVIFLPVILDGSGVHKQKIEVIIPPPPKITEYSHFDQDLTKLTADVSALPDLEPRFVDENSTPVQVTPDSNATKPEITAKPVLKADKKQAGGMSWVLQVGSYQDREKALKQRDKLRKSNIATVFIEKFKSASTINYRVRLGPFLNRSQTRVAQNKIKAKHDIDGIIMKYER